MSLGSSPTRIVRVTMPRLRSTTLTLSERKFATHASLSVRAVTDTGSRPTRTECSSVRVPVAPTVKISRRASGVFTARSRPPEGVSTSGWTWWLSKFAPDADAAAGASAATARAQANRRRDQRRAGGVSFGITSPAGNSVRGTRES